MTTATTNRYIVTDAAILGGEPIITGTRTPVRAIVELWRMGTGPEETHASRKVLMSLERLLPARKTG